MTQAEQEFTGSDPEHESQAAAAERLRRAKRAARAAFMGGALEYYDFFLYATASALIFKKVFFPSGDDTAGQLASFGTLGVAYVARPVGAVVFGHLGDRIGRKNTLLLTLVLMGLSTFLVGALPTYRSAGVLAPALLVALRLLQGLSAGAETAGAASLTMEESPVGRRAFFPAFTMSGISAGIVLSSLVMLPVAAMPDRQLYSWGWRLPFFASILVLAVAFLIRRTLDEPDVFEDKAEDGDLVKVPLAEMLRTHPLQLLMVALMSFETVTNTFMQAFGLNYAVHVGISKTTMLWVSVVGNLIAIASQPFFAALSDRYGRRRLFITGVVGSGILIFPYFAAISTSAVPLVFLMSTLITAGTYAMSNAIYPAWFPELFNVRVRYSGVALGLQLGIICAGFTPLLGARLVGDDAANWLPAALIVAASSVLAVLGAARARETYDVPLDQLGKVVHHPTDTGRTVTPV